MLGEQSRFTEQVWEVLALGYADGLLVVLETHNNVRG